MADLTDAQSALTTKIVGANPSTGVESNFAQVNSLGEIYTATKGVLSTANSTTTPLGSNATYTGTSEEVIEYAVISVQIFADRASAGNGFKAQYSPDGTSWDDGDSYTIPLNDGKFFSFPPQGRYFRLVYTNGNNAQTVFRLQTIFHKTYIKPSSHRIVDTLSSENDAELVKSIGSGRRLDGVFDSISMSNNNEQIVADISNNGGAQASLTVTGSATLVNCSGSNLTNRKFVTLYNNSLSTIYWGYTSGVTTSTGTPIAGGDERGWAVGSGTSIYAISAGGNINTRVTERA